MDTTSSNYWTAVAGAAATIAGAAVAAAARHRLTKLERDAKSDQHQFGLCCYCDVGLDDRADFVCDVRAKGGFALMCNACDEARVCHTTKGWV